MRPTMRPSEFHISTFSVPTSILSVANLTSLTFTSEPAFKYPTTLLALLARARRCCFPPPIPDGSGLLILGGASVTGISPDLVMMYVARQSRSLCSRSSNKLRPCVRTATPTSCNSDADKRPRKVKVNHRASSKERTCRTTSEDESVADTGKGRLFRSAQSRKQGCKAFFRGIPHLPRLQTEPRCILVESLPTPSSRKMLSHGSRPIAALTAAQSFA
mmetsp:Transcript_95221/g.308342  ORF Transcript_95221/g.308342 Transcript_95221/m.308342 type:complete len:217 (+) Transcript_95221:1103-1753(+)